jgi:hypothetical protein
MSSAPPIPVRPAKDSRTEAPSRRGRVAAYLLVGLAMALAGAALAHINPPRFAGPVAGPAPSVWPSAPTLVPSALVPSALVPIVPAAPIVPSAPAVAGPPPMLRLAGAFPRRGSGAFAIDATQGPIFGTAGRLMRYQVAVERGTPESLADFVATVDTVLGDPRSWTAGRQLRLRRVPAGAPHDFTIYLATAGTAERICARGGVNIRIGGEPFTSCRAGPHVVINLARWRLSAPPYVERKVPLNNYRQYVINHEVGHALGYGHVRCPGAGRPAPVMMKQTLGLGGCRPNPWPYVSGRRYSGPSL